MLTALEFLGLVAFAASGALAAVRARLDVFGVIVVGLTTALGGGIIRDVLLGIHPPTTLANWPYLAVCAATALIVFAFHPQVARLRRAVLLADAIGLGVFATAGTTIALNAGATAYAACLIGMTSGIGGGAARDLLLREIPLVLRKEIYAVAALAGAVLVAVGHALPLPQGIVTTIAAAVVVTIRLVALWRHWNAPVARPGTDESL
ncbi:trimeric intracellular cation channel family protein [Amycolatopsis sp. FDAARGOS 1241]|uniref:trimeric intracellular cation channel family protein n=1 Tax=unclassified Amycolatopsis TaxID=2618356 RepID=UPI00194E1367|nr:trimeric intracellular cation channel family protein [Amycolatopsis sp. FDAARGOS 1241]QRP46930.1 trimeric intracellular cation channel family protein [Amycolatopsis sp. FDAARGOS 1241]